MSDKLQTILDATPAMDAFMAHCEKDVTSEMCGLFVIIEGEVRFVACDNVAYDTRNSFLIHPKDFVTVTAQGDVIGVGHSHVLAPAIASNEDRVNSENCHLPFVIFQPEGRIVGTYEPTGQPVDLLGRSWSLGVSDCYTLVRDYFLRQGVELFDYTRNDSACLHKESLFLKHYEENGFHDVGDQAPKQHDVFLINVLSNIPNHAAVYLGENLILHHLQGRVSCRDPYGGYWQRHTTKHLRHTRWL